jgi:hypothetical protein
MITDKISSRRAASSIDDAARKQIRRRHLASAFASADQHDEMHAVRLRPRNAFASLAFHS